MKLFKIFLVFVYLSFTMSCTSTKMTPTSTSTQQLDKTRNDRSIEIETIDETKYLFEENTYTFKNDTIIGQAFKNDEQKKKWVKIAFIDIYKIQEGAKRNATVEVVSGALIGFVVAVLVVSISVIAIISSKY